MDGEHIGYLNVNYIQEGEVKTFRKYTKRKLTVGQPYGVQVFIDAIKGKASVEKLGKDGLYQVVVTLKERFKGLEERDIFIPGIGNKGKTIIGRGSQF